jgi:hypothetical protein
MMNLKTILICILLLSQVLFAKSVKLETFIQSVVEQFEAGKYQEALGEIALLLKNKEIASHPRSRGLLLYWKGLTNIRLNEYDEGIENLSEAIKLKFKSKDIHYEFGQALYVSERLKEARLAFRESVRNKYKTGVSLYYIAFISQQLKDYKKAVGFYSMIEKLGKKEKKDVLQASRMQTADIYLAQVEKLPNSFSSIEKYVIPQYRKALKVDADSKLAEQIQKKIIEIQKRYDLLVFKMRNGRATSFPRFFVRGNLGYSIDDNVTSTAEDTKENLDEDDYKSGYLDAGIYSRYTLYPNSSFSVSPEINLNYRKYSSDSDSIKPYNSLSATVGVQVNVEHSFKQSPATTYLNVDYTYKEDDANFDDTLEKSSDTLSFTISEEVQFWVDNPTTFRYRLTQTEAVDEEFSFNTHSIIWEQVLSLSNLSIFFYTAFDLNSYENNSDLDNSALTLRGDLLFPTFFNLFNPNLYISILKTNYSNDSERAEQSLIEYGATLSRPLTEKLYLNFLFSNESQTGKADSDNYRGVTMGMNLDYYY